MIWHPSLTLFIRHHARLPNEVVRKNIMYDSYRGGQPYGIRMGKSADVEVIAPVGKRTKLRALGTVYYGHPAIPY